ncbi:MAG: hypothetical protein ABH851_09620 [Methanobacteriota archaeon]
MAPITGIRLDYLMDIVNAITSDGELESILGSPLAKHIVLMVEEGEFRFRTLLPFDEPDKKYTKEVEKKAATIVQRLIKMHYPGAENMPEVK